MGPISLRAAQWAFLLGRGYLFSEAPIQLGEAAQTLLLQWVGLCFSGAGQPLPLGGQKARGAPLSASGKPSGLYLPGLGLLVLGETSLALLPLQIHGCQILEVVHRHSRGGLPPVRAALEK